MKRHEHDWYVLDLCRDYCRICTRLRRSCPAGHDHVRPFHFRAALDVKEADRARD